MSALAVSNYVRDKTSSCMICFAALPMKVSGPAPLTIRSAVCGAIVATSRDGFLSVAAE